MGSHSGSGHDMFTMVETLFRKVGERSLNPQERRALEIASESVPICKCQVTGSMRDGTETMAEMVERGHRLAYLAKEIRVNCRELNEARELNREAYESQPLASVISVDFLNRVRLPNH